MRIYNHGKEIHRESKDDIEALLATGAVEILSDEHLIELQSIDRIKELQRLLSSSDYKDLPSYKPKKGEDLTQVIAERDLWREEIRQLQSQIEVKNA